MSELFLISATKIITLYETPCYLFLSSSVLFVQVYDTHDM